MLDAPIFIWELAPDAPSSICIPFEYKLILHWLFNEFEPIFITPFLLACIVIKAHPPPNEFSPNGSWLPINKDVILFVPVGLPLKKVPNPLYKLQKIPPLIFILFWQSIS